MSERRERREKHGWVGFRDRFERWQIARVRAAYRRGTKLDPVRGPAFEAMLQEMRRALDSASPQEREQADEDVLHSIFFAPLGPAILRAAARHWPGPTIRLLTRASPTSLRFLVGDLQVAAPDINRVPHCAFRAKGGPRLCQEVCRGPSQAYTAKHGFPVRLEPDTDGPGCTWTWGASS